MGITYLHCLSQPIYNITFHRTAAPTDYYALLSTVHILPMYTSTMTYFKAYGKTSVVMALLLLAAPTIAARELLSSNAITSSDTFAREVSVDGGKLRPCPDAPNEYYLTLHGVGDDILVGTHPDDPSTARSVQYHAIRDALPRFAVLVTNNSETESSMPDMKFASMNLLEITDKTSDGSITYKVNVLNHDINNNGIASPGDELGHHDFRLGMVIIDLTPQGLVTPSNTAAITTDQTDEFNSRSLKHLVESDGLQFGPVPVPMDANNTAEVRAQGVWSTAFLGPFNAWAWICCAYKIPEHLIIGWVAVPSYVTLILCCV